jgi:hypothetical protein
MLTLEELEKRLQIIENQVLTQKSAEKLIPAPQMMERLSISRSTYQRNKHRLPLRQIGRRWFIREKDLIEIIEKGW